VTNQTSEPRIRVMLILVVTRKDYASQHINYPKFRSLILQMKIRSHY